MIPGPVGNVPELDLPLGLAPPWTEVEPMSEDALAVPPGSPPAIGAELTGRLVGSGRPAGRAGAGGGVHADAGAGAEGGGGGVMSTSASSSASSAQRLRRGTAFTWGAASGTGGAPTGGELTPSTLEGASAGGGKGGGEASRTGVGTWDAEGAGCGVAAVAGSIKVNHHSWIFLAIPSMSGGVPLIAGNCWWCAFQD